MLGLSNAMTSGSHHEQQYSLHLDGDSDYLDIGDNLDFGTNDFAISLWFKQDAAATSSELLFSKFEDTTNKINLFINGSNKIQAHIVNTSNDVFNTAGGTALAGDGGYWIHVVLTCDRDGDTKLYINGTTSTYGASASSANSTQNLDNTGNIYIGARSNNALYFPGKIDEVAIWQAADLSDFDSNAVQAIRNGGDPFDLNYDRGDYHHSASLTGYWRMGNGLFDDKQNGVVHDAHNPGFGSELITNGDFSTAGEPDGSSWSLGWHAQPLGQSGSSIADGNLIITSDSSDVHYGRVYATNGSSSKNILSATLGGTYKIIYTVSEISGSPTLRYYNGTTYVTISSTVGTHEFYFTNGTDRILAFINATAGTSIVKISNISLVQLNGYPGLTANTATFGTATPDD